ncbi:glycosyltransferase family 41 protein [Boletus edulis]|nr:glycosyltransferase family 41 protein [Boletus edulis]
MTLSFGHAPFISPFTTQTLTLAVPVNILTRIGDPNFDTLQAVHSAGDDLIRLLIDPTTGTLPNVVLFPDQIHQLSAFIFSSQEGSLPGIGTTLLPAELSDDQCCQESKMAIASVLVCLARRFQTSHVTELFNLSDKPFCTVEALSLIMHYLAASLFPNASTLNDIGVILCGLGSGGMVTNLHGEQTSAREVARLYYEKGLQLDPSHPHLLSNLGSLLKDAGHMTGAIGIFNHALAYHPELDIALVNMANTLRDMGRYAEAIPYYERAISVNPGFADAYCGLCQATNAVCYWNGRGTWMQKAIELCEKQLSDFQDQTTTTSLLSTQSRDDWMAVVRNARSGQLSPLEENAWKARFGYFLQADLSRSREEAGFLIRLIEWYQTRIQHSLYLKAYGRVYHTHHANMTCSYEKMTIPNSGLISAVKGSKLPVILPFHTFTLPLTARTTRLIAHMNALHTSFTAFAHLGKHLSVHPAPPPPFHGRINVGYVSSDFTDHPLTHLMKSVFTMHDKKRFNVYLYATSPTDGSSYREYYERQTDFDFNDVSSWSISRIIERIMQDQIHIRWCDYLVCDPIVCPPDLFVQVCAARRRSPDAGLSNETTPDVGVPVNEGSDPASLDNEWIYTECPIYMPHTYFATDHKQAYSSHSSKVGMTSTCWLDELQRRDQLRATIFPDLPKDVFIFANFNQVIFWTWLRILSRVQRSILWLLRFPAAGETNLLQIATAWAGPEVASRIRFTDVAPKEVHVNRCCVADLVLDTAECSAHTIASDVLWSGTPIIACLWPSHRHKMASRVSASLAYATGLGKQMVVHSREEYEERAVALASAHWTFTVESLSVGLNGGEAALVAEGSELQNLRQYLFFTRETMPLFDTRRWVGNLEKGFIAAWKRWVDGSQFRVGYDDEGAIVVRDDDDMPG